MDHSPTFALSIDSIAADSVEQSNRIEWVGGGVLVVCSGWIRSIGSRFEFDVEMKSSGTLSGSP